MQKEFREGLKYAGELVYGCGGNLDPKHITVLKRDGDTITFRESFGKAVGEVMEARVETVDNWGEFITVGEDRFFAYSVED